LLNRKFTSDLWKLQADNVINHNDQAREILANQIGIVESDPHVVQVFKDIPEGHISAASGKLLYFPVPTRDGKNNGNLDMSPRFARYVDK